MKNKLNCDEIGISNKINEFEIEIKAFKTQLKRVNIQKAENLIAELIKQKIIINNIHIITGTINLDISPYDLSDILINRLVDVDGIGLIGIETSNNIILICSITKDLSATINAGSIIKNISEKIGLQGGGSKHLAILKINDKKLLIKALKIGSQTIKNKV